MPLDKFNIALSEETSKLIASGTAKGNEQIVTDVIRANGEQGPRFILEGHTDKQFIRMNTNSYLGMSLRNELLEAEEAGVKKYGVGPGAVRFISGTYEPHVALEKKLSQFHDRENCMITSAAYTSVLGVVVSLATPETMIISDELNHNCIINAMKLARPRGKKVYPHLDLESLENQIMESVGQCDNVMVITDGVFSMRGDYAPLNKIAEICKKHSDKFARDIVLVVDDSHGVGAYGATGRGTEELCNADGIDILVATLGKAFGVNGGYIVSDNAVIQYLREKSPLYIYTNPITPSEACAALKSVELLDSDIGTKLLGHLAQMTLKFEKGIVDLGYETIPSPHPVVPLMVRDTERTTKLVSFLRDNGVLATGLNFPVVPHGDQLIRFQVSADHTNSDIDYVLSVLDKFRQL